MPLQFPPQGTPAWDRFVIQTLLQHRVDIQRLWKVVPNVPDPQAGIPFLGPTSPSFLVVPTSRSSPSP